MPDATPPAEAVAGLPDLKHATVSPDGDRVAFYHTGSGHPEIHVLEVATHECERWTDGGAGDTAVWPLAWDADGDRVLFHRDREAGGERYDVFAVGADGDPQPVLETAGSTQVRGVGPEGDALLVRSSHEGGMDAYLYDRPTDGTTRVTNRDGPVYWPLLSPAGDRVASPADGAVHVHDATGSLRRTVEFGDDGSSASLADWGPDGDRVLVGDDAPGVERAGVYDLQGGSVTWYGDAAVVEEPQCFLPDGWRFLALRKRDALAVPVVYDVETGEARELDLPEGVAYFGRGGNRVVDDERVLLAHATPRHPRRLLVYDLAADDYAVVFESDLGPFDPEDFVDPVYERVASDGVPETPPAAVEGGPAETFEVGTLLWDSGARPSPLVVFPHGGPHQADRRTFRPRVQFLCRRGYSVLQVNYRGSTGRGRAFRRALHGDWGGAEAGDVATAVEHALEAHDFLDSDRVAVYGGSFGGYVACWQLLQYPGLYDAGAAVVGITDLVDEYENTVPQFRAGFLRTHLGTPDENPDRYRERSPVTHASNLDAPLLVVHGENDPRVPVSQARRLRDALLAAGHEGGEGRDFEYHELADLGHWGESGDGLSRPLELLDDFLARRL